MASDGRRFSEFTGGIDARVERALQEERDEAMETGTERAELEAACARTSKAVQEQVDAGKANGDAGDVAETWKQEFAELMSEHAATWLDVDRAVLSFSNPSTRWLRDFAEACVDVYVEHIVAHKDVRATFRVNVRCFSACSQNKQRSAPFTVLLSPAMHAALLARVRKLQHGRGEYRDVLFVPLRHTGRALAEMLVWMSDVDA